MLIIGKMLYTWSPELIYPFKKKNYDPSLVISHFPLLPGPDSHLLLSDCMNLTALSCTSGTTWHLFFNDPSWFNLLEDRAKGWIAAGRGTQPNIEPNPNFTLVILQPPADMTQQRKKSEQQSITKKKCHLPSGHQRGGHYCAWRLKFPKKQDNLRVVWGRTQPGCFLPGSPFLYNSRKTRRSTSDLPTSFVWWAGAGVGELVKPLPAH